MSSSTKIVLFHNKSYLLEDVSNIVYLEADGNYTHFFVLGKRKITSSKILKHYESWSELGVFIRINRKYIINKNKIIRINIKPALELVMEGDFKIPISTKKWYELRKHIDII